MSAQTFSSVYGSCVLCAASTYQDSTSQGSCNSCPTGTTTFTQNQLQGSSFGQAVGAISVDSCTPTPTGYLLKGYNLYFTQYDTNTGYNTGGNTQMTYLSACNSFGKVLPGGSALTNGLHTESQCVYCTHPTEYFFAGGYTSISSITTCPPSTSCYTSYVYGEPTYSMSRRNSEGYTYSTQSYQDVASAECKGSCPAGTGIVQVGTIKTCAKCKAVLGKYSDGQGKCLRCDRLHYPSQDGASGCTKCPYPWRSRWNIRMENVDPPLDGMGMVVEDFGKNLLQYRSCGNFAHEETSLCLCVPTQEVLIICGIISLFFIINLLVFVCCTFGKRGSASRSDEHGQDSNIVVVKSESTDSGVVGEAVAEVILSEAPQVAEPTDMAPKPVLVGWKILVGLLAYISIPFVDNMTDLAFIISNPFYSVGLFVAMCIFYCLPGLFFFKTLMDKKALPRFYICPMPARLIFDKYDSLYKMIIGVVILAPYVIMNLPVLLPWLLIGNLLYSTKAFAVRPVANLWIHIWTGERFSSEGSKDFAKYQREQDYAELHPIDERVLNESLYSHIIGETFPILVIQFLNNTFSDAWTPLGYFSIAFSIFNSMSGIYRIVYYKLYLRIPLVDIPVDFSVMGVSMFGKVHQARLLGEGESGHEHHRLSMSRSDSGVHTQIIDEWVDSDGHVHEEKLANPIMAHIAEDILVLKGQMTAMEIRMDVVEKSSRK